MTVTLGTVAKPGLVIKDGAVESLEVTVDGSFDIMKLNAKATGLTLVYKKENSEFDIYGALALSTAAQGGVQVLKDVAVTLGNKEKPGIKIVDGRLEELDITINGQINLFKSTASIAITWLEPPSKSTTTNAARTSSDCRSTMSFQADLTLHLIRTPES